MSGTLFIADLHLQDKEPERAQWLLDLLGGPARKADALYILGDLFEYWIGDDALSASAQQVAKATTELRSAGVPCFFMHGNRDFLLGEQYAAAAGLDLLPESWVVDLYGTPTLLLHGDTLCTDDLQYQAFRQQSRNPAWQAAVLALTIEERLQMAETARSESEQHTGSVTMEIMDVNSEAVAAAFKAHQVTRMIHGHTHRPAHHTVDLGGSTVERIVVADWYHKGSYLEVSTRGAESRSL